MVRSTFPVCVEKLGGELAAEEGDENK